MIISSIFSQEIDFLLEGVSNFCLILFRTGENIYCHSQIAGIDILFCWIWQHSKFCLFLHFSKLQLLALWGKTSQHPTLKLAIIKTSLSWQSCWICSNPRWVNIPMSQYSNIPISQPDFQIMTQNEAWQFCLGSARLKGTCELKIEKWFWQLIGNHKTKTQNN